MFVVRKRIVAPVAGRSLFFPFPPPKEHRVIVCDAYYTKAPSSHLNHRPTRLDSTQLRSVMGGRSTSLAASFAAVLVDSGSALVRAICAKSSAARRNTLAMSPSSKFVSLLT